jgi:hypothetical protein
MVPAVDMGNLSAAQSGSIEFGTETVKGWFGRMKPVHIAAMKKGRDKWSRDYDVSDRTIVHLTRECGGSVDDRHEVDV